jgi:signal transduction histidine kinase
LRERGRSTKILATLHRASELLEKALTPEHAAWIALVALTAGEGFGFNRAFLLRRSNGSLEGWLGVGPRSGEEAARLWGELQAQRVQPLAAAAAYHPEAIAKERERLAELLQALSTSMEETCGHWHRAFLAKRDNPNPCVRHWLQVLGGPLVVLPLARQGNFWGVVLADNFVTRAPVSTPLLEGSQTLCHALQVALERTELWDRFRSEQEKRQRAEQALVLLETARSLAHDIKNPLTAAYGLLQHLLQRKPQSLQEWETWGEKIAEGLARVEQRVNQLVLELAQRGEGMHLTRVDAVAVVNRLVAAWQPLATSRHVRLETSLPPWPVCVLADPSYLDRCVENLLTNAIKAVGLGGEVRVSVEPGEEWVRLAVADNGQPLPPPWRANPFASSSGQPGGSGEGLASVRRLTEAMGGQVEYDEEEPGWVRFSLLLRRCT